MHITPFKSNPKKAKRMRVNARNETIYKETEKVRDKVFVAQIEKNAKKCLETMKSKRFLQV